MRCGCNGRKTRQVRHHDLILGYVGIAATHQEGDIVDEYSYDVDTSDGYVSSGSDQPGPYTSPENRDIAEPFGNSSEISGFLYTIAGAFVPTTSAKANYGPGSHAHLSCCELCFEINNHENEIYNAESRIPSTPEEEDRIKLIIDLEEAAAADAKATFENGCGEYEGTIQCEKDYCDPAILNA